MSQTTGDLHMNHALNINSTWHMTISELPYLRDTTTFASYELSSYWIHSFYFSPYSISTVYPMTYLMTMGHQCSGTSSYYDGCGMSLDEIQNILICEQHNMTSTSKPCTCSDLPSDLTVPKHGTGSSVMLWVKHSTWTCNTSAKYI